MQIQITDKATVQAAKHYIINKLIYSKLSPRACVLRDILLYTESVTVVQNAEDSFSVYITTQGRRFKANYDLIHISRYKSRTDPYPQHLKPILTFILNNIQNTIINQFSNDLSRACTTTLNNTHNKKLVNSVPKMY